MGDKFGPTDNEPVLMLAVTQQLTSRCANKWYFVLAHVPDTQSRIRVPTFVASVDVLLKVIAAGRIGRRARVSCRVTSMQS